MIDPKSIKWVYQEKKMSVKVKDVGNYKIHVKESVVQKKWAAIFFSVTCVIGMILEFGVGYIAISTNDKSMIFIPICGAAVALISAFVMMCNVFSEPAYYIDTTMYGVGGKTIRKTTLAQDHIAICQAAQEFEKEILERINKEKELEEIVGKCK